MTPEITITSGSVDETIAIGQRIGKLLRAGDVVALVGELGAGKTYLTKGIALGLGVSDEREVNSPTFVLVNEYAGRMPVYHIDTYRLAGAEQLLALGFEEMCQARGVVIIEWADRVSRLIPASSIWIEMAFVSSSSRSLKLYSAGEDARVRLNQLDLS